MNRILALTTITVASLAGLATTGTVSAADCPKGTIASTQEDGSVRCAKLTLVDPDTRGHLS